MTLVAFPALWLERVHTNMSVHPGTRDARGTLAAVTHLALRRPAVNRALQRTRVLSAVAELRRSGSRRRGVRFGIELGRVATEPSLSFPSATNPLEAYFDNYGEGPGIWKWRHYFPIYHRHFSKFIDRPVKVVEIGIYSGGSLGMWKSYFGSDCRLFGVDIEPACAAYEDDVTRVFIGDQADPGFWRQFVAEVGEVDVVIDDGGHLPHQQIATFQSLIPHMRHGGVYLCEDLGGIANPFHDYVAGFARNLHTTTAYVPEVTNFHQAVASVHFYPYVAVVEIPDAPVAEFRTDRAGSEWQPFLGAVPTKQ
jgi:hypothetical protein